MGFEIRKDQLITILRPDKKNLRSSELCRPIRRQSENKIKHQEKQVLRPWQRTKNAKEHEGKGDKNCSCRTSNGPQNLGDRTRIVVIRGRIVTIQITTILRSAKNLRVVLEA